MIDLKKLVRPNIWNLKPYSSARDEFSGDTGIFLDANENPYSKFKPKSKFKLKADPFKENNSTLDLNFSFDLNRYPDPYQHAVKQKISKLKNIPTDQIFLGNGSDEVIDLLFRIFCEPGKHKALTATPTYGMYAVSAAVNDVELMEIPLNEDFQMDMHKMLDAMENPDLRLVFLCSPNNPTGNLLDRNDIETVLERFDGIVVVDEAYIDFAQTESLVEWLDRFDNLVVSQTFSKAWGLAGARVGLAFAQAKIIALLNKIKPPYNISALNQQAVLSALENPSVYQEQLKLIRSEKAKLQDALTDLDMVEKIYPSDANFLLIKVRKADRLYDELLEEKIIVRNRSSLIADTLRITVGTPEENNLLISKLNEKSTLYR